MWDSRTGMLGRSGSPVPGGPTSEPSRFSGLQPFSLEDSAADVLPARERMLIPRMRTSAAGVR